MAPKRVAEVGVWSLERSNVAAFIEDGAGALLVEADPVQAAALARALQGTGRVRVVAGAVAQAPGRVTLYRRGESTFMAGVPVSPEQVNAGYRPSEADRFEVDAVVFDQLDDGRIELLSIDIEGAEWFVLERLVSRPAVLSIETHGKRYRNPYLGQITGWLDAHGYRLWYRGKTDSVYVLPGAVRVTWLDRALAALTGIYIAFRAWRYGRR